MLTEDEAKTKWCPLVRLAANDAEWHTNRPSYAEVHVKGFDQCIGSACMAWRWKARFGSDPVNPENCAQLEPTHGYCGLAGRPL